jgi:hypothetical protein
MSSAKVALSMPAEVLRLAKREVAAGRAKSLSSFVAEAVDEKRSSAVMPGCARSFARR